MRTRLTLLITLAAAILAGALLLIFLPRLAGQPESPQAQSAAGWSVTTPEEQGLDSRKLAQGLQAMADRGTPFHTILVLRNGRLVLDASRYPFSSGRLHNLASVTKSITSALIGIAIVLFWQVQ